MAFTASRVRIAPCAAEKETTYGTNPTIDGATDGFNTTDSSIVAAPEVQNTEFRNHGASFTRPKNILGNRLLRMNFTTMLQGSGTAGTAVQGVNDVLQASGMTESVVAVTSVTYAPSVIGSLESATIVTNHDGKLFTATGCYANATVTAEAGKPSMVRFAAQGLYATSVTLGTIASWSVGTTGIQRAVANMGITATLNNGTDTWITPTIAKYEIDFGNEIVRIPDMLSTTGLKRLLFADKNPTFSITLPTDVDTTGTIIQNDEFYTNWLASTTWAMTLASGSAGNINTWSVPKGQILDVQDQDVDGVRHTMVSGKITHDTPETELTLVQT